MSIWFVPRCWSGETCFIIAGGPSVRDQNVESLRGRRVIVINTSYEVAPWADMLFFGDTRWWRIHKAKVDELAKRMVIVTISPESQGNYKHLKKKAPPGLATDPYFVVWRRTALTAAMNIAFHAGVQRMILLGADGKAGPGGLTHHHSPHVWPQKPGCWQEQRKDLVGISGPLRDHGVEVINCSPGSALADLWPVMSLQEYLDNEISESDDRNLVEAA